MPDNFPPSDSALEIQQTVTGDRNQALGGMVVYVSGGQAVFQSAAAELDLPAVKATPALTWLGRMGRSPLHAHRLPLGDRR